MALDKQGNFSQQPSELPDVPSPNMTPDQIRAKWQTPLDELKATINNAFDKLNSTTNGANGSYNIGATDWDGVTASTVGALLSWLKANKTDLTGDHKGTWQGYTPSKADPGISSVVDKNSSNIGDLTQTPTNTKTSLVDIWIKNYNRVNPEDYGCVLDGIADDTDGLQAAANAAISKKVELFLPPQAQAKITGALSITDKIKIVGGGFYSSYIIPVGVNGIEIGANVNKSVVMKDFTIAAATRHTTTPNTLVGLKINGDTTNRPYDHVYENIYVDGFQTGIETNWMWDSHFFNVRTGYGQKGLIVNGLSVNNKVSGNSQFKVDGSVGSRGIVIGDGVTAIEGWWLMAPFVDNAETAIEGKAAAHIYLVSPILDHCGKNGITTNNSSTDFSSNWNIHGGYIGISGSTATAGVRFSNAIANSQNRGCEVIGMQIITYDGANATYGVRADGTESSNHNVQSNTIKLTGCTADIYFAGGGNNIAMGNKCLSTPSANNVFLATSAQTGSKVGGNLGTCNMASNL